MKGSIKIFHIETKQVYYQLTLSKVLSKEQTSQRRTKCSQKSAVQKGMMSKENNKKCEGNPCSF